MTQTATRPRRGTTRAERDAARRQQLIDTALDLFTQRGYQNTPIELLCRESGVTTRYFYQMFGSREALMTAVFDQVMARLMERVVTAVLAVPAADYMGRLRRGIESFAHAYLDDPRQAELACIQSVGISAELEARRRRVLYDFAAMIDAQAAAAVDAGALPTFVGGKTTLAIVGALNELVIDWLFADPRPPVADVQAEMLKLYELLIAGMLAQQRT